MKQHVPTSANVLGDLRAEYDHAMLKSAFYCSPDFRSLLESADRTVIVGRRGTGKSALFLALQDHWKDSPHTGVVTIAPEDYETIALHGALIPFRGRPNLVRAAAKLGWRYALLMEVAVLLRNHFKFSQISGLQALPVALKEWMQMSGPVPVRMRKKIEPLLIGPKPIELLIGDLAHNLQLNTLSEELVHCLTTLNQSMFILIDRLDEGYEADDLSIGLIDGFLHASIEINKALPRVRAFMFLRDNIFRTITKYDADYSRQIEGQVIRLHWDEYHLLNLIVNRLRIAFSIKDEASIDVWNKCTCRDLYGRDGFRECLRQTLYRPRDLLSLLNNAFYHALQHDRKQIMGTDLESSAKDISEVRYLDLLKEYQAVFPGLDRLTRAFLNGKASWTAAEVDGLISGVFAANDLSAAEAQHFAIFGSPESAIHALYGVGFLGAKGGSADRFRFCHDGSEVKIDLSGQLHYLVHPCYWRALNITPVEMTQEQAEDIPPALIEIRDEYDIDVSSTSPDVRKHRIGQIIAELNLIEPGDGGASAYEQWCHQTVSILFAAALTNIELKPNANATQRRDIVVRNNSTTPVWRRILEDYGTRQVIFEVKNYSDPGPSEYRQMLSYLTRDYGKLGFIITRDRDESLLKDRDLAWVREMFYEHGVLIVKLTATWLEKYLSKARSPQKHDAADKALGGLLDRYARNYLALGAKR
jgi:hypothetical protein